MVPANFMSVYVAENALGCETVYGTASALGQIASFVAAMCFGAIYNNLKRFTDIIIILPIIAAVVLVLDIIYMFWLYVLAQKATAVDSAWLSPSEANQKSAMRSAKTGCMAHIYDCCSPDMTR